MRGQPGGLRGLGDPAQTIIREKKPGRGLGLDRWFFFYIIRRVPYSYGTLLKTTLSLPVTPQVPGYAQHGSAEVDWYRPERGASTAKLSTVVPPSPSFLNILTSQIFMDALGSCPVRKENIFSK